MTPESDAARITAFEAPGGVIDLAVHAGDVVLLRGPNGSGKTSLLRALAGLPTSLPFHGATIGHKASASIAADELPPTLAFVPQDARDALVGLTVAGELRLRRLLPERPSTTAPGSDPLRGLGLPSDQESTTLSSGQARRLVVSLAARTRPRVLLLDEPAEGLDADGRATLTALLADLARPGPGHAASAIVATDHSGTLAPLATRIVDLPADRPDPPPAATVGAPRTPRNARTVLQAGPARLHGIPLPPLRLGHGLHALVGPNGAGKSCLLLRLCGLDAASLPSVRIGGEPPRPGKNVRLLLPHGRDHLGAESVADELLHCDPTIRTLLVPTAWDERHPATLSGGQAQRVALAKVLGAPASVYLLDEPEAFLDAAGRASLLAALALRTGQRHCVLVATHDPGLIAAARADAGVIRLPNPAEAR